jgi:MFS family permease
LGIGVVMGILILNAYGRLVPRRRVIEASLVVLGVFLAAIAGSGQISSFIARTTSSLPDVSAFTSILSLVVGFAFFAGIAYAFVAIPSQTQLQEDLPESVRGRVFGVLNMLVSVASFLPILIVGPIADLIGTTAMLILVAVFVSLAGVASILVRGSLKPHETAVHAETRGRDPIVSALGAELAEDAYADDDEDGDGFELTEPAAAPVAGAAGAAQAAALDSDSDGIGDASEAVGADGQTER